MSKEPIKIIKTDGELDKDTAQEIAREIMGDINKIKEEKKEEAE